MPSATLSLRQNDRSSGSGCADATWACVWAWAQDNESAKFPGGYPIISSTHERRPGVRRWRGVAATPPHFRAQHPNPRRLDSTHRRRPVHHLHRARARLFKHVNHDYSGTMDKGFQQASRRRMMFQFWPTFRSAGICAPRQGPRARPRPNGTCMRDLLGKYHSFCIGRSSRTPPRVRLHADQRGASRWQ